jgi:hypothetical protein
MLLSKHHFIISGDATQAYKKWEEKQEGVITDAMKRGVLHINYLKKKNNMAPGAGFAITVQSAVKDSRQRPYTVHDVKNEKGARESGRTTYEFIDDVTGVKLLVLLRTPKLRLKKLAKELISKRA